VAHAEVDKRHGRLLIAMHTREGMGRIYGFGAQRRCSRAGWCTCALKAKAEVISDAMVAWPGCGARILSRRDCPNGAGSDAWQRRPHGGTHALSGGYTGALHACERTARRRMHGV
jgi:hypothetical protein